MENFGCFRDVLEYFKIEKNRVGPHTNANCAWSTPITLHALHLSYMPLDSWDFANNFLFCPSGGKIVFTDVDHFGYMSLAR